MPNIVLAIVTVLNIIQSSVILQYFMMLSANLMRLICCVLFYQVSFCCIYLHFVLASIVVLNVILPIVILQNVMVLSANLMRAYLLCALLPSVILAHFANYCSGKCHSTERHSVKCYSTVSHAAQCQSDGGLFIVCHSGALCRLLFWQAPLY